MTKPSFKPKQILWVDLEMTGLNPESDVILEVAAIATDWEFKELGVYEGIVQHDIVVLDEKLALNAAFWDETVKLGTRLLEQNMRGKSPRSIEDELLAYIEEYFDKDMPILLAGNSVHMDRQFIDAYWPRLSARLHYRMLDVTAWKVVFEARYKKRFAKPEAHRALEDIRGSIEELKYYLKKVKA